jgi:hypothetical protein
MIIRFIIRLCLSILAPIFLGVEGWDGENQKGDGIDGSRLVWCSLPCSQSAILAPQYLHHLKERRMDDENGGARTGNPDVTLRGTQEEVRRNLTYCHDCHCDLGGGDCAVCRLSPLALRLLVALREGALEQMETHPDGTIWGRVCSSDVTVAGMGAAQKAGYCTALMRVGVYYLESPMWSNVNVREWRGWRRGRNTLGKVRFKHLGVVN